MNTHRAVIESSVPPMLELIASGPEAFCRGALGDWIAKHPLGEFEEGRVLQVAPLTEEEAQAEYEFHRTALGLSHAEAAGSVLWPENSANINAEEVR